jgi:hypothetical protein
VTEWREVTAADVRPGDLLRIGGRFFTICGAARSLFEARYVLHLAGGEQLLLYPHTRLVVAR